MNLRGLDLNLLVILHALLEEGQVSRAARRAGLTQPAMSNALKRCRRAFEDPLLVRVGTTMRLTPWAEALREPLAAVLREIGQLVDRAAPALSQMRRTVGVVMVDALAAALVQPLQATTVMRAPGISLAFHRWGGGAAALAQVAKGAADLAVSVLPPVDPRHFLSETVREEWYVLAMRADHPVTGRANCDGWLDHPHVVVSAEGGNPNPYRRAARRIGLRAADRCHGAEFPDYPRPLARV